MHEEDALEAAIAQSLGLSGSPDSDQDYHGPGLDGAALPPEAGVSFANIAKMGFAATGPKLSPGAPDMGECVCMCVFLLSVCLCLYACVVSSAKQACSPLALAICRQTDNMEHTSQVPDDVLFDLLC